MSDYATLKADVADWLARDDLTAVVPSLIRLAEAKINNRARVQDMVRRARASGNDTRYLPLPTNYLDMSRLWLWPDSDRHYSLIQVTPENLQILNLRDTSTSSYNNAQRYCVRREIEFDAPIGADAELEMMYYERYPAFVNDTDTNWILLNNYDVYLYGTLMHAEPYLRNDERTSIWVDGFASAMADMMKTDERGRVNRAAARVSLSVATP